MCLYQCCITFITLCKNIVVIPQDGVKSKFISFSRRGFINATVLLEMHACVMEYLVLCID